LINEIRIYIEGGGDSKDTKALLRQGFSAFFRGLRELARNHNIHWDVICSGSRNSAFDDFQTALRSHPDAFNVLLVDSEGSVNETPHHYLNRQDGWNIDASDKQYHLMVQAMEAWLITDTVSLKQYYGQYFQESAIPNNQNVEQIDKNSLESALVNATRHTQKGRYHKIRHGSAILKEINPDIVRSKARHCDLFFSTITSAINDE
jgi:hypothetical protein